MSTDSDGAIEVENGPRPYPPPDLSIYQPKLSPTCQRGSSLGIAFGNGPLALIQGESRIGGRPIGRLHGSLQPSFIAVVGKQE